MDDRGTGTVYATTAAQRELYAAHPDAGGGAGEGVDPLVPDERGHVSDTRAQTRPARQRARRPEVGLWSREDAREALAHRDIRAVFALLQAEGLSQRRIAALTGQSQSEVSEILAGRRVSSYDVLVRIAEGLDIPPGLLGLSSCTCTNPPGPPPHCAEASPPATNGPPDAPRARVWTGVEARVLRDARRMSIREFAAHLGVSDRMISKWVAT